ncbi:MAG: methyltransferase domain-containing protein [Spirochaetales bacterium]|nr:methyltransferase domain-containing protein [Spirochaetales bacterium]
MILRRSRQEWYELIRAQALGRTLDAACGEGDFGEDLLVEGQGMTALVGVDIDENALSGAKSHFGHHAPGGLEFRFYRDSLDDAAAERAPAPATGPAPPTAAADSAPTAAADSAPTAAADSAPKTAAGSGGSPAAGGSLAAETLRPWVRPGYYDTVAMALALHHVVDPEKVVALLWSLVAPGGRMVISEVVSDGLTPAQETARDLHHLKAWTDRLVGVPHNPTFNQGQVMAILAKSLHPTPTASYELLVPEEEELNWNPKVHGARIQFIGDYILLAKDHREYRGLRREFTRLSGRIAETGYCSPPRLNYIAVRP